MPLEKQVDAVKKNRQMLLLEECLHGIQAAFNTRFMALRTLKKGACGGGVQMCARVPPCSSACVLVCLCEWCVVLPS